MPLTTTETGGYSDECGDTTIDRGAEDADEMIGEAVFWDHRLVSVEVMAASPRYRHRAGVVSFSGNLAYSITIWRISATHVVLPEKGG